MEDANSIAIVLDGHKSSRLYNAHAGREFDESQVTIDAWTEDGSRPLRRSLPWRKGVRQKTKLNRANSSQSITRVQTMEAVIDESFVNGYLECTDGVHSVEP